MQTTARFSAGEAQTANWPRETVVGSIEGILFFAVSVLLTAAGGGAFAGAVL